MNKFSLPPKEEWMCLPTAEWLGISYEVVFKPNDIVRLSHDKYGEKDEDYYWIYLKDGSSYCIHERDYNNLKKRVMG